MKNISDIFFVIILFLNFFNLVRYHYMVCWTVAYLKACYQIALRINSCLHIITDTKAFVGFLIRSSSLLKVRLLSLAFTVLNLLPSIEMYDLEKSFSPMQNLLNSLKTLVIAFLLSLRKSEIVRKSGVSLLSSHIPLRYTCTHEQVYERNVSDRSNHKYRV